MLGPEAAAGSELDDALSGQDMKTVAHRDSAPAQLHRRRVGITEPVRLTTPLHLTQVALNRYRHGHPALALFRLVIVSTSMARRGRLETVAEATWLASIRSTPDHEENL